MPLINYNAIYIQLDKIQLDYWVSYQPKLKAKDTQPEWIFCIHLRNAIRKERDGPIK